MFSKCWTFRHLVAIVAIGTGAIGTLGQTGPGVKPRPKVAAEVKPTPAVSAEPVVAVTSPSKCTAKNGLTLAEVSEILTAHNAARSEQQLPAVTWDCRLAELAQEWAGKSIYEHREYNLFGENIFVSANSAEPIGTVVKRWMLEKPNWSNETATCAAGKVCTHYAQIMWRATKRIGCGINRSATGKWKAMVVCNYDPASKASGKAW